MMESIYKSYDKDQLEELLSNFLVNSWSFSKLSSFGRNEKAFEMGYVYGIRSKLSATAIAGQAYHSALRFYFEAKKDNREVTIVDLELVAFEDIDAQPANKWKLQKTTPTIEECKKKATTVVNALLKNFIKEREIYEEDLGEVIAVELKHTAFLTVNGLDIPLPCNGVMDLVIKTKNEGKVAILDHKTVTSYSSDEEMALEIGVQAIIYILLFEEKTGIPVDEVWFLENKGSQNKDGTPQIRSVKVPIDADVRRLYEALLYEPLKKMVDAVGDPDYVYVINQSDNFVDKAELYDFWARTMIAEVEDFNVDDSKKELVAKRLKKVKDSSIKIINPKVIKNFKENASKFIQYDLSTTDMTSAQKIEHRLRSYGIIVEVSHQLEGYSSNTYLVDVSAGVKISSIHSHRLDLASALSVSNVRVSQNLMVYEGRSYLAVEISKRRTVDLLWDQAELVDMKIPLGKDNLQRTVIWDLNNHSTPHVLICGATGSGKSVAIASIIEYAKAANVDNVVILDPKYEFKRFADRFDVCNDIVEIENKMMQLVEEMNELVKTGRKKTTLVVFDEFADALAASRSGKELEVKEMVQVGTYAPKKGLFGMMMPGEPKMKLQKVGELKPLEENLRILLQKGRSCGFRIVAATQRASVKVITGDAKVNFPVQICFRVPKETDSRVVIDEAGAESLAGMGDGLLKSPEYTDVVRFQSYYKP